MTFVFFLTFAILASSALGSPRNDVVIKSLHAPHIAGGKEVEPHSLPYQVALYEVEGDREGFCCGASLIAPQWVLTAAHCVDVKSLKYKAMVGVHNISNPEKTAWTADVEEVFIHYKYNWWNGTEDDIALLKLDRPAPINGKTIDTIRLPSVSQRELSLDWIKGTLSGWGKIRDQHSPQSYVLLSVEARILSRPICTLFFSNSALSHNFNPAIHLCTSGEGKKGGCFGDSGGPLTIEESDGQRTVAGVAAFIYDLNCESGGPTAFTRVAIYLDWIHNVTGIPLRP